MLRLSRGLGLVVVLAVAFSTALAQDQPGRGGRGRRGFGGRGGFGPPGMGMGGPGMGGLVPLAVAEPVQKELGLDQETTEKVQKLGQQFPQEMMAEMEKAGIGFSSFQQSPDLTPEERAARQREIIEKRSDVMKTLHEKFAPQLKEAMSVKQFERLQQISWQAAGVQAFTTDPDLVKALELTKEQRSKIARINAQFDEKMRGLYGFGRGGGGPPDFQAINEERQKLTKERDSEALEALSQEQQEKYTKLKGKPFDVAQLQMGPGGFGRGGFGGGGFGGPGGRGGFGGRGGMARGPNPDGRPRKKAIQGEDSGEDQKKE